MPDWEAFGKSSIPGVKRFVRDDGNGGMEIATQQDVGEILEQNKAMANHNDGYSPDKFLRRAASIPVTIIAKWMTEEGWDPYSSDPDCQRKLAQKLDSNEYRYLRTAEFRLGDSWKHSS